MIQDTPTAPRRNVVGNRNFRTFARSLPAWRANGSLAWQYDAQTVSANVRLIGSYNDDQNANRLIKSHATLDLQYGYDVLVAERQVGLRVGALNLFNAPRPMYSPMRAMTLRFMTRVVAFSMFASRPPGRKRAVRRLSL